jgi:hypothetical protein
MKVRSILSLPPAILVALFTLSLAACGGGGSASTPIQKTTPTITWPTPAAITYGTPLSSTQLDATASVAGSVVYNPLAGTVPTAGTQTLSVTFTPTDTTDYNNAIGSVQLVVNKAAPTVSVWPTASAITVGQALSASTLTGCTASVPGTCAWTTLSTVPAVGTDSESVTFTPTDATDYMTVIGSVPVVVNPAVPTITGVTPICYLDGQGDCLVEIDGTGFAGGQIVKITAPGSLLAVNFSETTKLLAAVRQENGFYSPGWYAFTVCLADGTTCSNAANFAAIGNQNTLAVGPDGMLFQNDQATGLLRKFTVSNGVATAAGSFHISGTQQGFAIDDKTNDEVGGTSTDDVNGTNISQAADDGNGYYDVVGQDANNGLSCFTRPKGTNVNNLLSCFTVGVQNAQMFSSVTGSEPWTVAMATLSGTTYAYTYSRKGTPMVWKNTAANANPVGSYAPVGFTDSATVLSTSTEGGWELVVFQSGLLSGTGALMSNFDKELVFFNATTMAQIGQPITLTGHPLRIAKDETNGKLIIASADFTDLANPKTTFASVSPSATTPVVLTSVSPNLAAGLAVSPDGKYLYSCQRANCDIQPNK